MTHTSYARRLVLVLLVTVYPQLVVPGHDSQLRRWSY